MRLIFAGTPEIAVPTLAALEDAGHDIVAVLTQPDAPGRRGRTLHPSPVKVHALERGLDVWTPEKASAPEVVERVRALDVDAAAVVAYGQILRPRLLEAVRLAWVNLHFSVLPAWRGAAPVQRAIMAGDDVTGATTFMLERGLDTGPVIGTLTERIRATDTAGTLLDRLGVLGAPLMVDSLAALDAGTARPLAQPDDGVSYADKLTREDAYVRWDLAAHVVDRRIRGCTPAPGAWTTLPDGSVAKLGPVSPRPQRARTVPGQLREEAGEVLVGTGTEPVALGWIAPAGKKPMPAADWWRGARLGEGAQLGEA
ncbi:methionyl-tRNA formyltransferase [Demequina sediminis]|jgi:methionyl-tRNA formyltransferase|uniref:Methionyl-tRNA formyltransferase n=1 Tax=Demequina sediminis TaxID=1930058 RepID=A0ABP9WDH1_9MICO|nr:methionyl-tRNA formyltransferase [Demequina sediminis]BDZ60988.1 methionyl-tRNA formyltransferase [Demequina sediminis]